MEEHMEHPSPISTQFQHDTQGGGLPEVHKLQDALLDQGAQIQTSTELLVELQAQLAELDERISSQLVTGVVNAHDDASARLLEVEPMIGAELEERMLGALKAALVPLAQNR